MKTKRGTIPWTDATLWLAVRDGEDLIVFIDSLHASSRNFVLTEFSPGLAYTWLTTESMAWTNFRQIFELDKSSCEKMMQLSMDHRTVRSWPNVHLAAVPEVARSPTGQFFP